MNAGKIIPLLFLGFALCGCATVPFTNRNQLMFYDEKDDVAMGAEAWRQVLAENVAETQGARVTQLNRVGKRIAAVTGKENYEWEFMVLNSDEVNAFALPGGKIAFYKPIFAHFANDSEVAVVMGHEIAHVLARHSMERQSQANIQALGGSAISAATDKGGNQNVWLAVYGIGTSVGAMLPYSRKHEYEADYIGMILMSKAGYDPSAAITFWRKFGGDKPSKGGFLNAFLLTHPMSQDRLAEMQKNLSEVRKTYFKK